MSLPSKPPEKAKSNVKHISNPRRLLILSPHTESQAIIPPFLTRLTGHPPILPSAQSDTKQRNSDATKDTSDVASTTPPTVSFAGYTTHTPLQLNTKYYSTNIPIWVDEIPSTSLAEPYGEPSLSAGKEGIANSPEAWKNEFISEEAREVRDAIGAIIVCAQRPKPPDPALRQDNVVDGGEKNYNTVFQNAVDKIKEIARVVTEVKALSEEERGEMGDVPGLILLVGEEHERKSSVADKDDGDGNTAAEYGAMWWDEELSDLGVGSGLEVVLWDPKGGDGAPSARNEYGELMGMARVLEVLETHQWSSSSSNDLEDDFESIVAQRHKEDTEGFTLEANELEMEMANLRFAINSNINGSDIDEKFENMEDDGLEVEQLEALMLRVQAIKDMGADLPEQERKKFAAKAIGDLMKDM